jgi:hypothetical protein
MRGGRGGGRQESGRQESGRGGRGGGRQANPAARGSRPGWKQRALDSVDDDEERSLGDIMSGLQATSEQNAAASRRRLHQSTVGAGGRLASPRLGTLAPQNGFAGLPAAERGAGAVGLASGFSGNSMQLSPVIATPLDDEGKIHRVDPKFAS